MMRILYVEDNVRDADLTVRALRHSAPNLQLETVNSIQEALKRLQRLPSNPIDLVLVDMHLRDGDGLSLLQHIREHRLPLAVVLITGMGDEETAVAALKARADDYIVKRKDYLDRLPITLESALNHYRADAARRARPLNVLYAADKSTDIESIRRHFAVHAEHLHLSLVSTGSAALLALEPQEGDPRYDVLLIEFHLPELNALEVLREVRLTKKQDLPVVLVFEEGDEELGRQSLKLGASSYLVKSPGYLYQLTWQLEDAHSRAELKRREAALKASEARTHAILNAIPDLMFVQSRDGTYLDYHATDPSSLLLPPEQFLGKKMQDILPPQLAADFLNCFEQALVSDQPVLYEYAMPMPEGDRVYEASIVSSNDDKLLSIVRDITERKLAEEALRESEERLRLAQQAARVGTWEWDVQTGASVWSEMIWELLGLEQGDGETTVEKFIEFIHPKDRDRVLRKVNGVIAEGEDYYDEFRIVRPDGRVLWVTSKGRLIRSADGQPDRMIGVNSDITERKLAEDALRESERRLRLAQRAARIGTWEWDVPRGEALWSEMMWELVGLEPDSGSMMTLERFIECIHPEDRDRALRKVNSVIADGDEYYDEFRLVRSDGRVLWISSKGRLRRSASGRPDRMLGVNIDITERKEAEAALRESEEKYRTLFESIDEGFCVFDMIYDAEGRAVDFIFLVTNPAFDRLTGLQNAVGKRVRELLPGLEKVWLEKYGQVALTGEPQRFTEHAAGLNRWYDVYAFRVGDAESRRVAVIFSNVTDRIRVMEALRRSEAVLKQAGQMANLGAWEVDLTHSDNLDENPVVWSEQVYRLFGYEPGSVEASSELFFRHVHPDDRRRIDESIRAAITARKPYSTEYRIIRTDGVERVIQVHALIDVDEAEQPRRIIGAMQDITESKEAEESLRKALDEVQKLKDRLHEENVYLQEEIRDASNFGEIITRSRAMNRVLRQAEQVAPVDTNVLILGETGTGKELLAHAIHNLSPRHKHPLVKVNCAALPAPLIESELFGHEKGAFTGADARRRGRFELADGGTIFLDEVGELPLDLQGKLLRVLEAGEFEHVGSSRTVKVDVRVIAATNRNLAEAAREGTFRSDLYYRLSIFPITLPPLRERKEDIPILVTHLVKQLCLKLGKEIKTVSQREMALLQNNPWPGNVRELRNVIERAVIVTQGPVLQLIDSLKSLSLEAASQGPDKYSESPGAGAGEDETLKQSEYNLIVRTLKKVHWKVEGPGGAAELLNISPGTLRSRMKKLGISRPKVQAALLTKQ